jgi:uncharacterized membrane protein YqiK
MGLRRSHTRRKRPSEKQKPFFDKQSTEQSAFFPASVQRKLSVGKANDPAEKEAESAASQVASQPVKKAEEKKEEPVQKAEEKKEEPVQKAEEKKEEPVQKAEEKKEEPVQKAEEKKEEPVQKAEKKEEDKVSKAEKHVHAKTAPLIQRAAMVEEGEQGDAAAPSFESLLSKRKGMGFELPDDIRKDMETKFHASFKDVRIHTDKEASDMCEGIHALAFAHGYDIYFNEGMYNPNALSGRELLAHELAHVVQQNG